MSSTARILASRRNGHAAAGPRTPAGRARASRNARRHGFNLPVPAEPSLAPEVAPLAGEIARSVGAPTGDPATHALACRIAEAMIDLRRIRAAKRPLMAALVAALAADPDAVRSALRALARLDRYERYALWRRRRAIRAFRASLARQNEPRKSNDIKIAPDPSTTNGKGCVPPRDPVGSRSDHSPANKSPKSEQTPHGEVET
jgi:hypothetical protein